MFTIYQTSNEAYISNLGHLKVALVSAYDRYMTADITTTSNIYTSASQGKWEAFWMQSNSDGSYSLESSHYKYVSIRGYTSGDNV